jgi:tyrosyl-tRNA synthetase
MIGDPSGKATERNAIANAEVIENTANIQKIVSNIFKNHEEIFWKELNEKNPENSFSKLPELKYLEFLKIIQLKKKKLIK